MKVKKNIEKKENMKNKRKKKKKAKGLSSLHGGGQVDGLPPAASTDAVPLGPAAITDLITKIGGKIENFLKI